MKIKIVFIDLVVKLYHGYIHKSIAESFVVTEDGSEGGFSSEEMIFDKQGKLLTEY